MLKFIDTLKVQNCLFMYQVEQNNALPTYFPAMHSRDKHSYQTISAIQNLLDVPLAKTNKYGKESEVSMYHRLEQLQKEIPTNTRKKLSNMKIKRIVKQAIFDQY